MKARILSVVALSSPFVVQAETLETLTVTGSRLEAQSSGAVTILNRQDIDKLNADTVPDLLRRLPHVLLSETSDGSGQNFVSIRGGESNFTLVLIDGTPVNDPTNSRGGGYDFTQLNVAAIEAIEVYRGGTSTLYGGDALSGIIHIKTRQGEFAEVSVTAGEFSQRQISAAAGTQLDDHQSIMLSASYNEQAQQLDSRFINRQVLLKYRGQYDRFSHDLTLNLANKDSRAFAEDSGGPSFASPQTQEVRENEHQLASYRLAYALDEDTQLNSRIAYNHQEESSVHPGIFPGVLDGIPASEIASEFKRWEAEVTLNHAFNDQLEILVGANYQDSEGSNDGFFDFGFPVPTTFSLTQRNRSVFAEATYQLGDTQLFAGARHDSPADFDDETSFRTGFNSQLTEKVEVFATYSEGYKLPSFFALASPLIGNPNLLPEQSESFDLGVAYELSPSASVSVNVFAIEYSDLVDFDPETFSSVNRDSVDSKGVETSINWRNDAGTEVAFNLTYNRVELEGDARPLRRRPKWFGNLVVTHAFSDSLSLTAALDARANFEDSAIPTGQIVLPGYARLALTANWRLDEHQMVRVTLDNALDRAFEDSVGFVDNGRALRANWTYTF